jgi:two-component system LytT family response regulator
MRSLISSYESPSALPNAARLLVKSGGRISFLRSEEVDWIEAQGDYVCLHTNGKKHLMRERISHLEKLLPHGRFLRIHRSTIVNIDRIKEMQPLSYGDYAVILVDGTRLTLSRSYRQHVFQRLTSAA